MRFMGDYPMTRNQTDIDCLLYLLKVFMKFSILIKFSFLEIDYA
jgi:hypothetical protein